MSDYLISRFGSPLHLMAYAYDRLERQPEYYRTGRSVPLCGHDRGARWQVVGPWADEWESYREAGLCRHCLTALHKLCNAAEGVTGDE